MTWLTPWVGAIVGIAGLALGGCRTNRTPFHSEMTRTEMREAVEERFAIGMSWDEVVEGLDDANMKWRRTSQCWDAPYSKGMRTMVQPPGTYWNAAYRSGNLTFVLDDQSKLWDVYYFSHASDSLMQGDKRLYLERVKP